MYPNLRKLASRLKQDNPVGESSSTAPPSISTRNKARVLEKNKKELCEKITFSQISHHLLISEYFSKEDAFEICVLPLSSQMPLCHQKLLQALHGPVREGRADFWTILLRALNVQHSGLTVKLDTDLHKLSKREKPSRIRKEDIGCPKEFQHIKHIGHTPCHPSNPFRRFFSLRSNNTISSSIFQHSPPPQPQPQMDPVVSPSLSPPPIYFPLPPSFSSNGDAEVVKAFFTSSRPEGEGDLASPTFLTKFLQKAGVTDIHLASPESRKLILEFIEKNGGMEAIRGEILRQEQEEEGEHEEAEDANIVTANGHLAHNNDDLDMITLTSTSTSNSPTSTLTLTHL